MPSDLAVVEHGTQTEVKLDFAELFTYFCDHALEKGDDRETLCELHLPCSTLFAVGKSVDQKLRHNL